MERITVLMSTYNGEKYIEKQLDSILQQEGVNVFIYIRDDCSKDSTLKILKKYSEQFSNIKYYQGEKNLKTCGSFFELMSKQYDTEYFALADQDDIWDKDKLITGINKLKELSCDKPLLYFSNLRIVDENGRYIRESHIKPMKAGGKYSYLADTFVTGCTAVFNKKLQQIAVDIKPQRFTMHDTWLYMVVSIFGECIYDFDSHICYRLHSNNVVGTRKKRYGLKSISREMKYYLDRKSQPSLFCAQELMNQFADRLDEKTKEKLDEFINYKKSIKSTIRLAFDRDLVSDNLYRTIRFRIKVFLHSV